MITGDIFALCLAHLHPCTGLIHVGAGNGMALAGERFARIPRLLALEADDRAFQHLRRNLPDHTGWSAMKALISDEVAETSFHVASNPNESGLLDPEALRPIWRNLRSVSNRQEAAITLSMLLSQENDAKAYNWLSIDCLPATRILNGLNKDIEQFDVIELRLLAQPTGLLDKACDKAESDAFLEPLGYRAVFIEENSNPGVLRVLYVRDHARQLEIHTDRLQKKYVPIIDTLSQENETLNQSKAQLEKDKAGLEKDKAGLAAACDEQADRAQQLAQEVEQLKLVRQALDQASCQIDQQKEAHQVLMNLVAQQKNELITKFDKQAEEIAWVSHFLDTTIKREVGCASRQIEALIGVQDYFATGALPAISTNQQGEPVSPEFSLYLIELVESNPYDLIIEFGSGSSTLTIAKTLAHVASRRLDKARPEFVSFDHLEARYQCSREKVQRVGLEEAVQVALAPLQDWHAPNGNSYCYCSCQDVLAEMASRYSLLDLHLLVIVNDMEPGLDIDARYPAGPLVIQNFSGATIEMIVGNASPEEQSKLLHLWQEDVSTAGLTAQAITERSY